MEKENKSAVILEINKKSLKKIVFVIILIAILVLGYIGFQKKIEEAYSEGYNTGVTKGANSIIQYQTEEEQFYMFRNGSVTVAEIDDNCMVFENETPEKSYETSEYFNQ